MASEKTTLAAGGILWRDGRGDREIAIVHRPGYDDWTLPKGKVKAGESLTETALREVREETGHKAKLGAFADELKYERNGETKFVLFWHMEVVGKRPTTRSDEVDVLRWLVPEEALKQLTYAEQQKLVKKHTKDPPDTLSGYRPLKPDSWLGQIFRPSRNRLISLLRIHSPEFEHRRTKSRGTRKGWCEVEWRYIKEARTALEDDDVNGGWRCFHEAKRFELLGFSEEELEAHSTALEAEAKSGKLNKWRSEVILTDLKAAKKKKQPNLEKRKTYVFHATLIRDEHANNVYFKVALLRNQMVLLVASGFFLVTAFILLLFGWDAGIELGGPPTGKAREVFASTLLGGIGACLTGLFSLSRMNADMHIPERIANSVVTLARPLIGAASALAAFYLLQSNVISFGTANTLGAIWAASFAFGFSEKLVIGAFDKLKPSSKAAKKDGS